MIKVSIPKVKLPYVIITSRHATLWDREGNPHMLHFRK